MPDQIHIADLLLRTIIGINEEEREKKQDVLINITMGVDLKAAGQSDQIEDAVNRPSRVLRLRGMSEHI